MKKSIISSLLVFLLVIITGCGSVDNSEPKPSATVEIVKKEIETTKVEPTVEPTVEPVQGKELTADEQLALDYVNIYLNGSDIDAKKQFVSENVRNDVKSIFELGASSVSEEKNMIKSPEVLGSSDYETSGMKGNIVLISGESGNEIIMLVLEGKIGWGYNSNSADEAVKKTFDEMKSKIK